MADRCGNGWEREHVFLLRFPRLPKADFSLGERRCGCGQPTASNGRGAAVHNSRAAPPRVQIARGGFSAPARPSSNLRLDVQPGRPPARNDALPGEIAGRFGGKFEVEGGRAGPGGKVDAPELSSGPEWKIQEVSQLGALGVTSKSKLLAREMPRVCSRGSAFGSRGNRNKNTCSLSQPFPHRSAITSRCRKTRTG